MMQDPERAPRHIRFSRLAKWLGIPISFGVALLLVLAGFPVERELNQQWLRWTTGWYWHSEAAPARYTVALEERSARSHVTWPQGEYRWQLGPLYGPVHRDMTGVAPWWDNLRPAFVLQGLPTAQLNPPRSLTDRYWQPADHGYKSLVYRTDMGLVFDAQLTLLDADAHWRFRPGLGLEGGDAQFDTNWRGGLLLLDFAVPEPVRDALGERPLPIVSSANGAGVQALREHWALQQGFYLVEPVWLTLIAAITVVLPWLWPALVSWRTGAAMMLMTAMILLNLGLIVGLKLWWPLWYPLISVGLAGAWHRRHRRQLASFRDLEERYRTLGLSWLRHLLDNGKTEAGHRFLVSDPTLSRSPDLTYELAQGFERRRQYSQALDCLDRIAEHDPEFRDVRERRTRLRPMVDGQQTVTLGQESRGLTIGEGVQAPELGRYRILREVGRGNMGVVYEAEDPKINRRVAIKVVQLEALDADDAEAVKQRFFREAQAAGRLNHPSIVTVFDVGEEHDLAYIAMDLLQGEPLSRRLEDSALPGIDQVCLWLSQAADALDFAHRNDIIHRDIKPANLFIDRVSGRLKITDFGVARIAGLRQTQTGIVLGSPSYMAPEQIRGEPLTGATDVFSLGVTLYQCLCGRLPFEGETLPALAYAITHNQQESPKKHNPDVPVALVRIVNKALKKDPAERYASAGDMAQALAKWAGAGE